MFNVVIDDIRIENVETFNIFFEFDVKGGI